MTGHIQNQNDLKVLSPFLPRPRDSGDAGWHTHSQPSHVPWASWCKWLVNWGWEGCLEIGHQFLQAKLSSWNWVGLTIFIFQSCCIWLYLNLNFFTLLSSLLATYWGTFSFIKPLFSFHSTLVVHWNHLRNFKKYCCQVSCPRVSHSIVPRCSLQCWFLVFFYFDF